jgi:hypothetical protein
MLPIVVLRASQGRRHDYCRCGDEELGENHEDDGCY